MTKRDTFRRLASLIMFLAASPGWGAESADPLDGFVQLLPGYDRLEQVAALPADLNPGDGENVSVVGRWAEGPCFDVVVDNGHCYVSNGSYLEILDVRDPVSPVLVGRVMLEGAVMGIALNGTVAYVAAGDAGLRIVDVSNPAHPIEVGFGDVETTAIDVCVHNDHAFVTVGDLGMLVFDVETPASVMSVASLGGIGSADDIAIVGDVALVASSYALSGLGGVRSIDISNPRNPTVLDHHDIAFPEHMVIRGTYAYLPAWRYMDIVDISDPANLRRVGQYRDTDDDPGYFTRVSLVGDHAYLSGAQLRILDVSTPWDPYEETRLYGMFIGDSDVEGDFLFGANSWALEILDVSAPVHPTVVWTHDTGGLSRDVCVSGEHAFVTDYFNGLSVVDVSDPARPVEIGYFETGRITNGLAMEGDLVYVLESIRGLRILDASKAPDLVEVQRFGDCGGDDVYVSNGIAYVAGGEGLQIVDVSDPKNPFKSAVYAIENGSAAVVAAGGYAFVADWNSGVWVIDVTDPTNPYQVAYVPSEYRVGGLAVAEDRLYVSGGGDGLRVIDVSDPSAPLEVSSFDPDSPSKEVAVVGNMVYLADLRDGVRVIDVSNPAAPVETGFFYAGYAYYLAARGNHVFVTSQDTGLWILNNDDNPAGSLAVYAGDTDNNGVVDASDVLPLGLHFLDQGAVRGEAELAWYPQPTFSWADAGATYADADGNGVVDERDLFAIGVHWGRTHPGGGTDFAVDPGDPTVVAAHRDAYLALYNSLSGRGGPAAEMKSLLVDLLELEPSVPPARFHLAQNAPNPFNPRTSIRFELPEESTVLLRIYDVAGRLVEAVLEDRVYGPGVHWVEITTEGLGSGVYFYRLTTQDSDAVRKMTVIK